VWVVAADEPLAAVLQRFAETYDVNVTLTAAGTEAAQTRITVRLLNVPLATALRSLADQCGLEVVRRNNVFTVTTPEHAKKLREDQERVQSRRDREYRQWLADREAAQQRIRPQPKQP
jgi:hypothetical protein